MPRHSSYDAVVIGAGPNGLAAAITLARAGRSVLVYEAHKTIGGGTRSAELTLPGFMHDICSAIHPLGLSSPFFRDLPLDRYGLEWIQPPSPLAHPLDDGTAMLLERSIAQTGATLGQDAVAYSKLMFPLASNWEILARSFLGPLRPQMLQHPFAMSRFGLSAIRSIKALAKQHFKEERAAALLAGMGAHSFLPLEKAPSAAFGLVLGASGHAVGWPLPRGGSQAISNAMAAYLEDLGGEIVTDTEVKDLNELPQAKAILCDITPLQLLRIAGKQLPEGFKRSLRRYRYGPGVFKIDYAMSGPIPWKASECRQAATVHLGGTLPEIASSEREIWQGKAPERPFVLVAQQSLFDTSRAPAGQHTGWAYCHVPNGSSFDMTDRVETQIERFAPGFRDLILARHITDPAGLERYNANYIGGDINGGVEDFWQLFTRPTIRLNPYTTPARHIFLCSASTPPGGGVHGMCGYYAAQAALGSVLKA